MKIFIKTFGCRVNQVESQAILEGLEAQNHAITANLKEADLCLLNTCSVTHKADRDVEREIRRIIKENPKAKLIISGCYAMSHKEEISQKFPTATTVFKADLDKYLFEREIDWSITRHQGHSRAFVKIQDGCDNFCAYCIVPYTRPNKTSKPMQTVVEEVKNLVASGQSEIVLTGINIGNYHCPETGADLAALLPKLFAIEGNFRLRFSSIEANTITPALIEAAASAKDKFCNYFHIPLQSGSDAVLKAMGRHYTTAKYLAKLAEIRAKIKGVSIYCDIIAGYPTETEEDFKNSIDFVKQAGFAGLHVFSYSARKGTPASALKQLPAAEIKKRAEMLRSLDKELRQKFAKSLINTTQQFLAEEYLQEKNQTSGVLANFQRVIIENAPKKEGLSQVKITSAKAGICYAKYI
ncbi:MAG: tRNA (N(6)-L-threonylcarbamoyladenosine(37)-C(2))-methylthiotransferase MtaB [Elusimicrobiota bacterium]|jgi:threonylcarbamoyladenosine tRNA methylthiotransferase MtaB|nr:tRNA (N(6)-L-threonylcarbamoyladenosine(37)-C(2))-methylthiotransferase MtaB [Elusimicrobiota bacterium]